MPVTYEIDAARKLVRTRCVGPVRMMDVLDHFRTLEADPACPPHADVFLDLVELQSLPKSFQLAGVVYEVEQLQPKVRFGACAIVVDREVLFGMMRIFATLAEGTFRVVRVFRKREEAEQWLQGEQSASTAR
ncbi:hypothetical protein Acid345_0673 [Candidatus Koribacter versatilis Ellin345]|uniref:STAS/SEC14 domain-containing protein n=1 Tax=Koribacter versatilis (strain Ellin345) TaxID=204669 RepID=Q1ITX2_KORVE|nr:STAS/SEC14 domain-containing protein [Candidatus Koribacter versatilis]ABF39678.1 hypothetical protein Acid345_0673 [Candidatus Koribacter versatilis Ellin345]